MNFILWVLRIAGGLYFIYSGISHFVLPPGLPAMMSWMYELSPTIHILAGTAEILGGLGLILPAVTKAQTRLVPLAALGLLLVMVGQFGIFNAMSSRVSASTSATSLCSVSLPMAAGNLSR